jgi:hypothetical protein
MGSNPIQGSCEMGLVRYQVGLENRSVSTAGSIPVHLFQDIAQVVAYWTWNPKVKGSSPFILIIN